MVMPFPPSLVEKAPNNFIFKSVCIWMVGYFKFGEVSVEPPVVKFF